jgi:hypothetical protein
MVEFHRGIVSPRRKKGGTRVRTLTFQIIGLFTWLRKNLVTGPHRVDRARSDPKDRRLAGQLTSGLVEGRKIIKKNLSLLSPNHCRPILSKVPQIHLN